MTDGAGPGEARHEILARIRTALGSSRPPNKPPALSGLTPRQPVGPELVAVVTAPGPTSRAADLVERFSDRLADYGSAVVHCAPDHVGDALSSYLRDRPRVIVPAGLNPAWIPLGAQVDGPELGPLDLDRFDAVVTQCRLAVAESGTIVLDAGPDQGRRALTLIPDHHICVVRSSQIVGDVADAMDRLDPTRPLTWISGPSATSDIELQRVAGVHGPRRLDVIVVHDVAKSPSC